MSDHRNGFSGLFVGPVLCRPNCVHGGTMLFQSMALKHILKSGITFFNFVLLQDSFAHLGLRFRFHFRMGFPISTKKRYWDFDTD